FIALMGVVAQTYDGGPYKTNTESGRQRLLSHVIDRVSAYGFCTDSEYGSGALNNTSSQRTIRAVIDGQVPTRKSFLFFKWGSTDNADAAFSALGIGPQQRKAFGYGHLFDYKGLDEDRFPTEVLDAPSNERAPASATDPDMHGGRKTYKKDPFARFLDRLRGAKQTPKAPTKAYSDALFNDPQTDNVAQRRWNNQAEAQGHMTTFPNSAFSSCTQGLQRRGGTNSSFNICQPDKKGFAVNLKNYNKNDKLRNALYENCGLKPPRRKKPSFCPNQCIRSAAYGAASWLRECEGSGNDGDPGGPDGPTGKGGEGESGRGPGPGGKGGEDSGGRGPGPGGKGGEASGSHGGGDAGGKGGEASSTR
ncbi:MAG: hypothetical protein GW917_03535, partial [Bdellovibrionales bacterium]|nr:hypothetical protein [Bdellovibrionales bacterium]